MLDADTYWAASDALIGRSSPRVSTPKPASYFAAERLAGGCLLYRLPVNEIPRSGAKNSFAAPVTRTRARAAKNNRHQILMHSGSSPHGIVVTASCENLRAKDRSADVLADLAVIQDRLIGYFHNDAGNPVTDAELGAAGLLCLLAERLDQAARTLKGRSDTVVRTRQ